MCKVSILVPIYNVEKYLEMCLESLAAQDMEEIEFICLNDGSKDSSGEIAHRFEQKDSRFCIIDKENSGYGKTMNIGLGLAKGKYVGYVPDLLVVDTEGEDENIVRAIDYVAYCPKVIEFEINKVDSQEDGIIKFLNEKGYNLFAFIGSNAIFVQKVLLDKVNFDRGLFMK